MSGKLFWYRVESDGRCRGKYDVEFMDYTIRVLCKCREYGFRVYMDPHQDTVRILLVLSFLLLMYCSGLAFLEALEHRTGH